MLRRKGRYFIIQRSNCFSIVKSLFRNSFAAKGRGKRSKAGEFLIIFQRVGANDKKEHKIGEISPNHKTF